MGLIARPNRETRNYALTVAIRIPADGPLQVPVVRTERAIEQPADGWAVKWEDVSENFVRLEMLRRCCPCAGCKGEIDVMGNLYKNPDRPLPPSAFELRRIANVGGYAIQPIWGDGHATGLYSFEYLKKIAATPDREAG